MFDMREAGFMDTVQRAIYISHYSDGVMEGHRCHDGWPAGHVTYHCQVS